MKKYVYTIWTKPWLVEKKIYNNLLYLVLSLNLLQKYSKNIKIYTDSFGEEVCKYLLDKDIEVINSLDKFESLDINRWSIPKLYTINNQNSEFCHLDHDVFLFNKLPIYNNVDFVIQSEEKNNNFQVFYKDLCTHYINNNINIPNMILKYISNQNKFYRGLNCGYMEFYNIEISKYWTNFAIELNNVYTKNFRWIDCCFIEQFTLYLMSKENNFNYKTLFDFDRVDNYETNSIGYVHLMTAKNEKPVIKQAENILKNIDMNKFEKLLKYQKL